MRYQQAMAIRKRTSNVWVGILATTSWFSWVGYLIGAYPPKGGEWVGVVVATLLVGAFFWWGTISNAWTRGVYQAWWQPESDQLIRERKMIEDDMRRRAVKLGVNE